MLLTIAAIGRLKAGPERELFERYFDRVGAAGRKLGLTIAIREFPESRASSAEARKADEAQAILGTLGARGALVALDEGGKAPTSATFAAEIAKARDGGVTDMVFAIGGADGHGPALLAKARSRLAFGQMTWPHQLVRVMLAEQLYRAVTILSGHPYHRE